MVVRKVFFLTLILGLAIILSGCETNKAAEKGSSSTDNLTVQIIYQLPKEKIKDQYSVEEFKVLYDEYLKLNNIASKTSPENEKTGLSKEEQLKYYTVSDITPENVRKETGCQVFKVNYTCETYVIHKGEFFRIGFGFGGFGVVSLTTCDFDDNGQKDLIYTFSWGSGLHRSHIGTFNLSTKKEMWPDFVHLNEDIMLEKISDGSFDVYTTEIELKEELNYTQYKTNPKKIVTKVTAKNGNILITSQ